MKLANTVFILTAILTLTTIAGAQVPAQTAPAKVGVVNSATFSNQTGGITKLVNALRVLDAEFKPRRDEISTMISRFETLRQAPTTGTTPAQITTRQEQAESLQIEIQRKQEDARVAYTKRFGVLTDPIRLSILNSLEAYGKQRGLDILIDLSKFPDGVLLLNPGADLTAAFIRDFNSKNP